MTRRISHATPNKALAGAAVASLVGVTGMAAVAQDMPLGLLALGMSAAGLGIGVARRLRGRFVGTRARYERFHRRLAGPRPGARLG